MSKKNLTKVLHGEFPNSWPASTKSAFQLLISRVQLPVKSVWRTKASENYLLIRCEIAAYDRQADCVCMQSGRWWVLSQHMTAGEIYQTMLKAYLTWLEHEARENFLVDGKAIYGPHLHPTDLMEMKEQRRA